MKFLALATEKLLIILAVGAGDEVVWTSTHRDFRDALKKKITYNEKFAYLGVGGVKKIPTILNFRNGTFFSGRGGQNFMFYVSFLEKSLLRRDNFQFFSPSIVKYLFRLLHLYIFG